MWQILQLRLLLLLKPQLLQKLLIYTENYFCYSEVVDAADTTVAVAATTEAATAAAEVYAEERSGEEATTTRKDKEKTYR